MSRPLTVRMTDTERELQDTRTRWIALAAQLGKASTEGKALNDALPRQPATGMVRVTLPRKVADRIVALSQRR